MLSKFQSDIKPKLRTRFKLKPKLCLRLNLSLDAALNLKLRVILCNITKLMFEKIKQTLNLILVGDHV